MCSQVETRIVVAANIRASRLRVIFAVVALFHLVRIFAEWTVIIGDWSVPKSVSWVALIVAGSLALVGLRGQGHGIGDDRTFRRRSGKDEIERRVRPYPHRADQLDPSHPGMSRHRLPYPLGPGAYATRRRSRLGEYEGSRGMKYVDEYRDRAKAQILVKDIERLVAGIKITEQRPLQIMEVCGGHTHSIFRYGIEGLLPKSIEL